MSAPVALDSLPLGVQARHLRRAEPGKAVAIDLEHDGMPIARMFYGHATNDPVTMAAARMWAQLAYDYMRTTGAGQ